MTAGSMRVGGGSMGGGLRAYALSTVRRRHAGGRQYQGWWRRIFLPNPKVYVAAPAQRHDEILIISQHY